MTLGDRLSTPRTPRTVSIVASGWWRVTSVRPGRRGPRSSSSSVTPARAASFGEPFALDALDRVALVAGVERHDRRCHGRIRQRRQPQSRSRRGRELSFRRLAWFAGSAGTVRAG